MLPAAVLPTSLITLTAHPVDPSNSLASDAAAAALPTVAAEPELATANKERFVRVHLVDGTYELFRYYFALPGHLDEDGVEVDAVRGVLGSVLALLEEGATHIGVATDHIIESFRNDLWPGYKTGAGIDPALLTQFPLLEDALRALGVTVWAMVELEADDALAAAARVAVVDGRMEVELFRTLATLRDDAPVGTVDDWRWRGPTADLERWSERLGAPDLLRRARKSAEGREP